VITVPEPVKGKPEGKQLCGEPSLRKTFSVEGVKGWESLEKKPYEQKRRRDWVGGRRNSN